MAIKLEQDNNALVIFDDRYINRIIDVQGAEVTKFVLTNSEPLDDTTYDPLRLLATMVEAGVGFTTCVNSVTAGEKFTISTAGNENDGCNLQAKGESFKLDATKKLYFGAKVKVSDITQSDLLVGLAESDTTLMAAHAVAVAADGAFFAKVDGSTTLMAKTWQGGAETSTANYDTALTLDATWFEIFWDRETIRFYINNELVTSVKTLLVNGDVTPSLYWANGAAASTTCDILEMKCFQW